MDDARFPPATHRLTVSDFEQMGEAGILVPEERIELIDGELYDMAPIGEDHAATVGWLNEVLVLACAGRAIVAPQNPVLLDPASLPQPDFTILRRRKDFYRTQRPGPADILLLIEVADTSLRFDRTIKLPRYARAGIAEFWLVDLQARLLEVHRRPATDGYEDMTLHQAGESLALTLLPEIIITLGPIFG